MTWPGNRFTHKGGKLQKNRNQLQSVGYSQETPPLLCHRPSTRPLHRSCRFQKLYWQVLACAELPTARMPPGPL